MPYLRRRINQMQKGGPDAGDVRALDAVLLGALDVVFVNVDAYHRQVLRQHFRCIHAERERGSNADVKHLKEIMRGLERGDGAQRRVSCAGIHCDYALRCVRW